MRDSTRARVAAVVGAASKDQNVCSVYEYASGRHRSTSVYIGNGRVSGYDHRTSSYFFGGNGGSGKLDFFDFETAQQVQLKMNGINFDGYDHHSGKHFSGTVHGGSLSLYDHETGHHYNFAV